MGERSETLVGMAVTPVSSSTQSVEFLPVEDSWILKSIEEIDKACAEFPCPPQLEDETGAPEWVERLQVALTKSYFAGAFRGPSTELTPGRFGYALGRQIALMEWHFEFLTRLGEKLEGRVTITPEMEHRASLWYEKVQTALPHYRRSVHRTLLRASDAESQDRAAFFRQYGEGLSSGLGSADKFPGAATTTASDIYEILFWFWRSVEKFNSVRDVHRLLVKLLGANRVGAQKRVEKICQRIGLTLRPPGRPCVKRSPTW